MGLLYIYYFIKRFGLNKLYNVGHSAILHGCTVEDESFVGMKATLLDGVVVEKHGMVAAGALVRQDTRIPAGEVLISSLYLLLTDLFLPYVDLMTFPRRGKMSGLGNGS